MIAVLQRVASAQVVVDGREVASIAGGLLALVAAVAGDDVGDVDFMARKFVQLRIFADETGRMNRGLGETGGALLLVSQFTLAADTRKGRRPSFTAAMPSGGAAALLHALADRVRDAGVAVQTGEFGAHMQVRLVNDGPVTLLLDSRAAHGGGDQSVAGEGA